LKLSQLLEEIEYTCIQGNPDTEITKLVYDSREADEGAVFVCIEGFRSDGHSYVAQAVSRGAQAVVACREVEVPKDVTLIFTEDTRLALACMSAAFFGHPARELTLIGITGTKGKTTTSYMIRDMLEASGIRTGLIGTIEIVIGDEAISADNTTPESYVLQSYFRRMADANVKVVVMEVSSQGLMLHRVSGFTFEIVVFTNIEPDHIGPGEHKNFEDYKRCKGLLFKASRIGVANADDAHMNEVLKGSTCALETFGTKTDADLYATDIVIDADPGKLGVKFKVCGSISFDAEVGIPGRFTVYNSLAAIAVCRHFDVPVSVMREVLKNFNVKGRVELIDISPRFILMLDYAHNAVSLRSLLSTLKEYEPKRLVCMFGCGGDRARDRRFTMGTISSQIADLTVVTSDNPRYEDPQAIIDDIIEGVERSIGEYVTVFDRKEAIRYCIKEAKDGDMIVLAGKGHEAYQEIRGVKYPMDERVLIAEILAEMTPEERAKLNGP